LEENKSRRADNHGRLDQVMLKESQTGLYYEEYFKELLALERKRCKHSERPTFLILADLSAFPEVSERHNIAKSMMGVLSKVTRATDVKGWHVDGVVMGIIFTEIASKEETSQLALSCIAKKCLRRVPSRLGEERFSRIQVSWQSLYSGRILDIHKGSNG